MNFKEISEQLSNISTSIWIYSDGDANADNFNVRWVLHKIYEKFEEYRERRSKARNKLTSFN